GEHRPRAVQPDDLKSGPSERQQQPTAPTSRLENGPPNPACQPKVQRQVVQIPAMLPFIEPSQPVEWIFSHEVKLSAIGYPPPMRILAVDVGTGTQDILLFDSEQELENSVKMVMPSPTLVVADTIRRATAERRPIFLRGVTMGGGPSHWAAMDHLKAGHQVYATPA